MMTNEEIDANLYALGIGTDARGLRVLVLPSNHSALLGVRTRLEVFGACVHHADDLVNVALGSYDYVITDWYPCAHVADHWLKPGGRYLVLLDGIGDNVSTEITEVVQLGGTAVRVLGYKPRRDGVDLGDVDVVDVPEGVPEGGASV